MDKVKIQYRFLLENGKKLRFIFHYALVKANLKKNSVEKFPSWTQLEKDQCPNCPLCVSDYKYCPLAVNLVDIIEKFDGLISHEKVHLIVETKDRKVSIDTTVQHGMSSLMGLAIASSGCPQTAFFAPMAHFHMPLANVQETVFRAVSSYMLSQYFLQQEGKGADFNLDGLTTIYKNLQTVNVAIAKRLRSVTESDSAVNAIIILDTYAQALPIVLDTALDEIKQMYLQYYEAV